LQSRQQRHDHDPFVTPRRRRVIAAQKAIWAGRASSGLAVPRGCWCPSGAIRHGQGGHGRTGCGPVFRGRRSKSCRLDCWSRPVREHQAGRLVRRPERNCPLSLRGELRPCSGLREGQLQGRSGALGTSFQTNFGPSPAGRYWKGMAKGSIRSRIRPAWASANKAGQGSEPANLQQPGRRAKRQQQGCASKRAGEWNQGV